MEKKNQQREEQMVRFEKTKKELRVNARNQIHWNRFEESSFWSSHQYTDTAEEKINELEYMTIETSQT